MSKKCSMCLNAKIDDTLTDNDDYSAFSIGKSSEDFRIMMCSGWNRPVRIEFEKYEFGYGWSKVAVFVPRFCPFCGREITEYKSI